jgi:hypothetical protein
MAAAAGHIFLKGETMLDRFRCVGALILLLGVTLPCAAQNAPAPQTRDPNACSNDRQLQAGRAAPRSPESGDQSLSEKLTQTDGVICPPDIDPDIKAPTPEAGRMPVIPPPGSPGGDPTLRPK